MASWLAKLKAAWYAEPRSPVAWALGALVDEVEAIGQAMRELGRHDYSIQVRLADDAPHHGALEHTRPVWAPDPDPDAEEGAEIMVGETRHTTVYTVARDVYEALAAFQDLVSKSDEYEAISGAVFKL